MTRPSAADLHPDQVRPVTQPSEVVGGRIEALELMPWSAAAPGWGPPARRDPADAATSPPEDDEAQTTEDLTRPSLRERFTASGRHRPSLLSNPLTRPAGCANICGTSTTSN